MDISLLKRLGNIDQIAGIRRQTTDEGLRTIEVYNAVGLRYTLVADRALDHEARRDRLTDRNVLRVCAHGAVGLPG